MAIANQVLPGSMTGTGQNMENDQVARLMGPDGYLASVQPKIRGPFLFHLPCYYYRDGPFRGFRSRAARFDLGVSRSPVLGPMRPSEYKSHRSRDLYFAVHTYTYYTHIGQVGA